MRFNVVFVSVVLCGCSSLSDNNMVDGSVHDGPAHNGDGPVAPPDGGTPADIQCQAHTYTTVKSDGTKTVQTRRFALIDGVSPGDHFFIEECDEVETLVSGGVTTTIPVYGAGAADACPAGATCTATGTPLPTATHACSWAPDGTFLDGKLYVYCGGGVSAYDATGALTSSEDVSFGAIRIHH